jgi:hypothetical protein
MDLYWLHNNSWRDEAVAYLDDLCTVDASAAGIDRTPNSWWKTSYGKLDHWTDDGDTLTT